MAQTVKVQLIDDMDGGEAAETVGFGLDGKYFEIDLSAENAQKLRDGLSRFVGVARRSGKAGSRVVKTPGPRHLTSVDTAAARSARAQNALPPVIREWAKTGMGAAILEFKAIAVPSKQGRISKEVQDAYENRVILGEELNKHAEKRAQEAAKAATAAKKTAAKVKAPAPAAKSPEEAPTAAEGTSIFTEPVAAVPAEKPARKRAARKSIIPASD